MAAMSDNSDDNNVIEFNADDMRKKVEDRVRRESDQRKKDKNGSENEDSKRGSGSGDGGLPSNFVGACLRTNQLGDGEMFKALHRGRFVFCKNMQTWLKWDAHHWVEDTMDDAMACVDDVADAYENEAKELRMRSVKADEQQQKYLLASAKAMVERARMLRGDARRQSCLKFSHTSKDPMAVSGTEIDANPWLLGVKNGVIELKTGRCRDGRPDDWILKASPIEWQGIEAKCPKWEKAVLEIMAGDQDMVNFLQRLFGYSICGKVVEKIFPVFIGPGGDNGKTVLVETVSYVLGQLGGPIASEMLTSTYQRSPSGIDTDTVALKGLRFAYASETEDKAKVSAARVKRMTGNDTLEARSPYDKRSIQFEPSHTQYLLSNYKLRADSEDNAFWNRVLYIPFTMKFVRDREPAAENELKADPHLDVALREEAPGILAWLVRGFLMWQKNGLCVPAKVLEESKRTREDLDYFGLYLDECFYPDDNDQIGMTSSELYYHFESWYHKNIGRYAPKIKTFGSYMKKRYEGKKTNGVMRYFGLEKNYKALANYDPDEKLDKWA